MILDSILILEFIVINLTPCFKVLLIFDNFFDSTNAKKHAKKHAKNNSWSPKIFAPVVGLGVFGTLIFNSIPE